MVDCQEHKMTTLVAARILHRKTITYSPRNYGSKRYQDIREIAEESEEDVFQWQDPMGDWHDISEEWETVEHHQ